jgi:glycosyltransferase involved in cell wall biosynthesis
MNSSDTSMLKSSSFMDIPIAHSIEQILVFDSESFIYCAYRTLLKREPDTVGMVYYTKRLIGGESKLQILKELYNSAEGQNAGSNVTGLKATIRRHSIGRMFGMGRTPSVKQQLQSKNLVKDSLHKQTFPTNITSSSITVNTINTKRELNTRSTQSFETKRDANGLSIQTIWIDLTTSMEWKDGVVGIVRAELEIASSLNVLHPNVRFAMLIGNGFVEIPRDQLRWLLDAENVADAYMKFFGRYKDLATELGADIAKTGKLTVEVPQSSDLYFPFKTNDIVFSAGWMDSNKESIFSQIKQKNNGILISYLIYDMIMLLEGTKHFYDSEHQARFKNYVEWISCTTDYVIYGGVTAKNDTEALQLQEGWPTPPGVAVRFGTDIVKSVDITNEQKLLSDLGVKGPFIIVVGSIEPRKNHDTLFKAYLLAQQLTTAALPQLFICGRPAWRVDDLVDTIDRDPNLVGKVIRFSPTDTQLAVLYKHCSFTVLPSLYEGWSLTLPESLGQGKFCICTDTPPLREIGGTLVDYAPGWDIKTWAEKIILYSTDIAKLKACEQRIINQWPNTSWRDTAKMILDGTVKFANTGFNDSAGVPVRDPSTFAPKPTIWMDITLTFLQWQGNVTGVIRSELSYARYLKQVAPTTRFFAYSDGYYFEVEPSYLLWLWEDSDLSTAYSMFHRYWQGHELAGTGHRNPFHTNGRPLPGHPAYLDHIPENSIVLFVGIDFIEGCERSRTMDVKELVGKNRRVITSQLIYDFTPFLCPQFHKKETCSGYVPFIKHVSENFDHLLYGGRTAQRDGIQVQQKNGWKSPPSDFVEFGSNMGNQGRAQTVLSDSQLLEKLGLVGDFIMTVGTIEPRKNHEMIYKAYITLLERHGSEHIPKLLFIGKEGWKSSDFLATFHSDKRIKGKILIISPTDDELDALYRRCLFTLLPSFYEGWSLTLPESLGYGKFCLTSDVDPLKETGRDLVEYINPLDTYAWADRIYYYATHPAELSAKEIYIKKHWKSRTWRESTIMMRDALYAAHKSHFTENSPIKVGAEVNVTIFN